MFSPSALGTQSYWNSTYQTEFENYNDHGDIGEGWFGNKSVKKMIEWIQNNQISKDSFILDLGCGNGHLLISLYSLGFFNLTGIDYSDHAIMLSNAISKNKGYNIEFKVLDFLFDY